MSLRLKKSKQLLGLLFAAASKKDEEAALGMHSCSICNLA